MIALTSIAIVLVIIIYYIRNARNVTNNKGSKGNEIPLISGLPLAWALLRQRPHDEVQDVIYKSSGGRDIYFHSTGSFTYLSIINPEYVKDLLVASEDVAPKFDYKTINVLYKFYGDGLTFINGDPWRTRRKLANPAFNKALTPQIAGDTAMELFTFMQQNLNRPVDIFEIMQRTTIEILGKLAFDHSFGCLESDETPHIINLYKFIISTVESVYRLIFPWINKLPIETNRKYLEAVKEFDMFIIDMIENKMEGIKKNNKRNSYSGNVDLLTSMLEFSAKEGINADTKQLRDEIVTFFVAGHDTTSMALSTSLYYLAKYPEMQEKARAEVIHVLGNEPVIPNSDQLKEMKYVNAIVKESLRMAPPAAGMSFRNLSKPIKIGPYVVPENTLCFVNIWQVHYNPKYWENPKQYNPERFLNDVKRHPFSWIPFSSGPRNCIGQNFSLMEQRVILSMMLLKYKWTLPENSINKDKLLLEPQFLLKPVDLKLVFTERN